MHVCIWKLRINRQFEFSCSASKNREIASYRFGGAGNYMEEDLNTRVTAFTFVMWINLNAIPAILLSADTQDVVLSFDDQAKLKFAILNTEIE